MIPDRDFIWVSFFLPQRLATADFSSHPRCYFTQRNAPIQDLSQTRCTAARMRENPLVYES